MRIVDKPTQEELAKSVATLTDGGKVALADWAGGFLPVLSRHLRENPVQYRNFGPWWWSVKKAMLDAGLAPFGQDYDAEMVEAMAYPEAPFLAVVCGMLYYDQSMDNQFIGQATHTIVENGEDVEYTLYDHDAEAFIVAKTGGGL
jgi:hypothetical protein